MASGRETLERPTPSGKYMSLPIFSLSSVFVGAYALPLHISQL